MSTLSRISAGYAPGAIQNIQNVVQPLQVSEFIAHLAKYEPVHDEELEGLAAWTAQLPNHITKEAGDADR